MAAVTDATLPPHRAMWEGNLTAVISSNGEYIAYSATDRCTFAGCADDIAYTYVVKNPLFGAAIPDPTATPTITPSPYPTTTPTSTPSPFPTTTPTQTATPTATSTDVPPPTYTPTVTPTSTVTPQVGSPQMVITSPINNSVVTSPIVTISWENRTPGRPYRYQLGTDSTLQTFLIDQQTSASTVRLSTPLLPGVYYLRVGLSSSGGAIDTFTVVTFTVDLMRTPAQNAVLTAQSNGTANASFSWYAFAPGTVYNVDVDLDGDFISNLENGDAVAGCMTTALNCNITNLAVGEKVWRLRINGQITPFVRSFVVSPPILPAPRLLTPTNNRIFGVLSTPPYSAVNLSWSAVNNASGYVLQIDEKREFDTELLFERVLSETQLTVDAQTLGLADGTYYWRVASF